MKYDVHYFKCEKCGFIQTEKPYWLSEAYDSAITQLDIGLVNRNVQFSEIVKGFFDRKIFRDQGTYLDFAGGYGLFVRLMRDLGFNFYRQDAYCENIFAKYFDLTDLPKNQKFDVLTAFEVFEHLENPRQELEKMLSFSENILFSTLLQPGGKLTPDNWWYFTPQTGQHIALYSKESLEVLAKEFGLFFYTNGINFHIFSKRNLGKDPFEVVRPSLLYRAVRRIKNKLLSPKTSISRPSLTQTDFEYIKNKL